MPSEVRGAVIVPGDAAVQQQPKPVGGEVAKAPADAFDLFDGEGAGFGGSVAGAAGGVPVEDGGLPAADGAGEATHLGGVAGVGPGRQQLEGLAGAVGGGGAVDLAGDVF